MPLSVGTRLGPYEIVSALGAGGMGEVYRARDTQLNRNVAIKVLPELFALDAERLARFTREAQTLAALNHPNIAQIYGIEASAANTRALVMELVEGEDLAERLAGGRIPVREALELARQIADALATAHDVGIVHRDLKPANIKVRDDGIAKVLDFGLAKLQGSSDGGANAMANSPTLTSPAMTHMGVILGTAAYMAPEQAKGRTVDRGADTWAFGAVLYEMLAGRPAFEGETVTDVLAAIVTRDPDWTALPGDTPAPVRRLLRRCLERERRRRLADAGEIRYQIEETLAAPSEPLEPRSAAPAPARRVMALVPWLLAAALAVGLIILAQRKAPGNAVPVNRYGIEIPSGISLSLPFRPSVAISPDGTTVVFAAERDGTQRLYVRRSASFEPEVIAGTDGASHPVISPDGRWIAFMTPVKLSKVPLGGGPVVQLASVNDPRGLSWDDDNSLLFAPTTIGGIFRIPAAGGTPLQVTTPTQGAERTHRWPQELPGGSAILYTVGSPSSPDNYDDAVIDAQILSTGERKRILSGAAMARYVPTGHLLFARGRSVFAVPFDPVKLEVTGTPRRVLDGVTDDPTTGASHFSLSRAGALIYVAGRSEESLLPMWVDRSGAAEPLALPTGLYADPVISPDGSRVAFSVVAGGGRDIWIHDLYRKTFARMTFSGQNLTPQWSHDGADVYYSSFEPSGRKSAIRRRPADASREAETLVEVPERTFLTSLTPDDRAAVISIVDSATVGEIARIDLQRGAKPTMLVATPFQEYGGRLSRDGRWLAYVTHESGRAEVWVRGMTGGSGRWQVSTAGGMEPVWSPDGRQLYYRNGSTLMSATVASGTSFQAATPVRVAGDLYDLVNETKMTYDFHSKTDRFLMIRPKEGTIERPSLRIVLNWIQELKSEK